MPSLIPPSRRMARTTFSTARISLSSVRRATRGERQTRGWRDLTWTCRYQPMRMIWAGARASLRSVLLGIVFIAALATRVSMQIAGRPAARRSSCSQAVSEQASRLMRSSGKPSSVRAVRPRHQWRRSPAREDPATGLQPWCSSLIRTPRTHSTGHHATPVDSD